MKENLIINLLIIKMEIKGEVVNDSCDGTEHPYFKLEFSSGDLKCTVVIDEPYIRTEEEWGNFIAAIRNRTSYLLGFYQGNGEGYIECTGTHLVCYALPSGSGGDMSVEMKGPLEDKYADMFQELVSQITCRSKDLPGH
jgi:hypothetical protein